MPNRIARGLSSQKTQTIGLIVPDVVNPFFGPVVRGAETAARRAGYRVLLCNSEGDLRLEREYIDDLISHRVEGLPVVPVSDHSRHSVFSLLRGGFPLVLLDRTLPESDSDYTVCDSASGARRLVEHLISVGHCNIAHLTDADDTSTGRERLKGYREALESASIPYREELAEPINAGGGIIVPPKGYFPHIQKVLQKYDILFLADEIVCGFGRTGNCFGKETVNARPEMMALAKGLSAAHFPISAVVVAPAIYEALREFNKAGGNFGHGFTNSGHLVGVAISLEAVKIYEEMNVVEHAGKMGARLRGHFDAIAKNSAIVGEVRGAGLMLGMELVADRATKTPFDPHLQAGAQFDHFAYENGLIARCMGDVLGFSPPLIVTEQDVDEIAQRCEASLKLRTQLIWEMTGSIAGAESIWL